MPDWTKSMSQTYEYYIVDPGTWKDQEKITNVESCSITRDEEDETKASSSLKCVDDHSDNYIRTYLVTTQNGIKEKTPLGTFLYQTPALQFDGMRTSVEQDGYSPLIELKERPPQLGYALRSGVNIMSVAAKIAEEQLRAPVIETASDKKLIDSFISDVDDTWLYFLTDLIANASYTFGVDEMGQVLFEPKQSLNALQPRWEFDDGNSSILYAEVEIERDLYGVPNVVEVVYSSNSSDSSAMTARVVNNDENSPTSVQSRGREIVYRDTNPEVVEGLTKAQLKEYATELLKNLSSVEYTVSFKHGYCPVRVGDCVLLNYPSAGLNHVRARITRQIIRCEPGCAVEATAVYTKETWEG